MNKDLKIFLISGKARHGKDTTSDILKDALIAQGKRVLVTHYADLVKYICKTFFGWDGNKDERGRSILQYVGTEVVREKRPNYWVEFVMVILWLFGDNWDCIIVPDARFPNEISFPKDTYDNVYHINVVRPNFDNGLTEEQKNHPSEIALDEIAPDFLIENTSLYELEKSILRVLEEIEKGKDRE